MKIANHSQLGAVITNLRTESLSGDGYVYVQEVSVEAYGSKNVCLETRAVNLDAGIVERALLLLSRWEARALAASLLAAADVATDEVCT